MSIAKAFVATGIASGYPTKGTVADFSFCDGPQYYKRTLISFESPRLRLLNVYSSDICYHSYTVSVYRADGFLPISH